MDYQLPRAVITLKQGAGRLIRDETDRGTLMICDPRLVEKPYGRRIWRSLPPFKRTRSLAEVEAFFAPRRESQSGNTETTETTEEARRKPFTKAK
jgi:ATP-dependent DNA helicase DinG